MKLNKEKTIENPDKNSFKRKDETYIEEKKLPILLLISLNWTRLKDPCTPLSLAYIAANSSKHLVTKKVLQLKIQNYSVNTPPLDIFHKIMIEKPDYIAWGVYGWNEVLTHQILWFCKEFSFEGKIILGGPQITYSSPELLLKYQRADYFIRGEGETAIVQLLCKLISKASLNEIKNIPNVVIRGFQDHQCISVEDNLDSLPSPYLMEIYPIFNEQAFLRWQTSRGCPFSCSFCAHRINGRKVRYFPHKKLYREIDLFNKKNVKEIAVLDPIFNLKRSHYIPLLKYIIKSKLRARLELQCRLEFLNDEFLELCQLLPEIHLEFGIQTLNETESKLINRKNDLERIKSAIRNLNNYNLSYETHLIFGLPTQTRQSLVGSINHLLKLKIPIIRLFPLQILRGTKLSYQIDLWKLKSSEFFPHIVLENNSFTLEDWLWARSLSEILENYYNKGKSIEPTKFWGLCRISTATNINQLNRI